MPKHVKTQTSAAKNPQLFAYEEPFGICRIERINLPDGRVSVICQELHENPGAGIWVSPSSIANQVCERFKIDPCKLVWIEHYAHALDEKPTWELVKLKRSPSWAGFGDRSGLSGPFSEFEHWKSMELDDWRELRVLPRYKASHTTPVT
jgi:hypothetical protein